jgi:phosphatidylcholine synthase
VPDASLSPGRRSTGFGVHTLTALGAVTGILALEAVFNGRIRRALVWLVICQVLDGIDGPIARKLDVKLSAPHIDGHVLDLVVDYVTCVVVPVVLLLQLDLGPHHLNPILAGAILVSSALWFARTDQETDDAWFRGFPAMWNIVIPSFIILGTRPIAVVIVCATGCALQLSNVEFPHIVRAPALRKATATITVLYFATFVLLSANYPHGNRVLRDVLLLAPLYLAAIVVWRTFFPHRVIVGQRVTSPETTR